MPNSQGQKIFKYPIHHKSWYIWPNHSGNHTGYSTKPLTVKRHEALLQMQRMDPFYKCIWKRLSNGKTPQYEADLFLEIRIILQTHHGCNQKFLALIIPKVWKYTVLVEAHDKPDHQEVTPTYCLIKCLFYWKGMNKDIQKYIANCTLCWWEKAKV